MLKLTLLNNFKKLFSTDLIYPEIFHSTCALGFFSKRLPLNFDFTSLDSFKVFFPKQVHSTKILEIDQLRENLKLEMFKIEGDGIVTSQAFLFIGIRTADCVPILITDKTEFLVGALHAGWRGCIEGFLYKFLKKLINLGINTDNILIAIGPHIKSCCYEVREDVIEKLKINFENYENFLVSKNQKIYLDLEKLNYYQALECGIPTKNIWISKDCTYCLKDSYWSYRFYKEKNGFQISLIGKIK